jgi:hypothetical protein
MKSLEEETALKAKRHTEAQSIRNNKLECLFDQESWDIRRFSLFVHVACAATITHLQCSLQIKIISLHALAKTFCEFLHKENS